MPSWRPYLSVEFCLTDDISSVRGMFAVGDVIAAHLLQARTVSRKERTYSYLFAFLKNKFETNLINSVTRKILCYFLALDVIYM